MNTDFPDGQLTFDPFFLEPTAANRFFDACNLEICWKQHVVKLHGKQFNCPRLSAWYGDPGLNYTYSGLSLTPRPWTPTLLELRTLLEVQTGLCFNTVLANLYRNGSDSMGWHADNEPELGKNPVIASVSLGATRRFCLKHRKLKQNRVFELTHGSLLLMAGETQHHWRHGVPKTTRYVEPRINLTFRIILT